MHNFYSSLNIIRVIKSGRIRWAWHVAYMKKTKNANKILARKSEGKRLLGRPWHRWDNIKIDLNETCEDVNYIQMAQHRIQ
jgi:hypothetical protein